MFRQLAGLQDQKEMYKEAVKTLANGAMAPLILVTKLQESPLLEAKRASEKLARKNNWFKGGYNSEKIYK